MQTRGTVFRGAMLVAGTTIGGGMLAVPVSTAQMGFWPSVLTYFICWAFMASTGLLFLEICLWLRNDTNIVSMADRTLGWKGRYAAWALYLFLFYCLTVAYVVGGGNFLVDLLAGTLSSWQGAMLFVVLFGSTILGGARIVGPVNVLLMVGLGAAYLGFVVLGLDDVRWELLSRRDWHAVPKSLPVLFAAFGFQGLVPTLSRYMGYQRVETTKAILIGSFVPVVTFIVWQGLILGIVPLEGPHSLATAQDLGENAVRPLKYLIGNPYVYYVGQFFAFFALTTSFLGVTLGLSDFLADGLKVKKTQKGRMFLALLIFLPPLLVARLHPTIFIRAIEVAGGFGVALLLGVLPILMVWSARYRLKMQQTPLLPGGRFLLVTMLIFVLLEVLIESVVTLGFYPDL